VRTILETFPTLEKITLVDKAYASLASVAPDIALAWLGYFGDPEKTYLHEWHGDVTPLLEGRDFHLKVKLRGTEREIEFVLRSDLYETYERPAGEPPFDLAS